MITIKTGPATWRELYDGMDGVQDDIRLGRCPDEAASKGAVLAVSRCVSSDQRSPTCMVLESEAQVIRDCAQHVALCVEGWNPLLAGRLRKLV